MSVFQVAIVVEQLMGGGLIIVGISLIFSISTSKQLLLLHKPVNIHSENAWRNAIFTGSTFSIRISENCNFHFLDFLNTIS